MTRDGWDNKGCLGMTRDHWDHKGLLGMTIKTGMIGDEWHD